MMALTLARTRYSTDTTNEWSNIWNLIKSNMFTFILIWWWYYDHVVMYVLIQMKKRNGVIVFIIIWCLFIHNFTISSTLHFIPNFQAQLSLSKPAYLSHKSHTFSSTQLSSIWKSDNITRCSDQDEVYTGLMNGGVTTQNAANQSIMP